MRARRRAALEADPDAPLRDADELLSPAVAETLAALDLKPEDAAAAKLAERYAAIIDAARDPAWAMRWLAPLLADALTALQATPMSRKAVKPSPPGPSRLDELRMRRVSVPGRTS
jgi:hypothetical protein